VLPLLVQSGRSLQSLPHHHFVLNLLRAQRAHGKRTLGFGRYVVPDLRPGAVREQSRTVGTMQILLIDAPYDCGQANVRMGAGPTYLIDRGLAASLRSAGHEVRCESVRLPLGFHTEWDALIALQQQIAALVRSAVVGGERVLVLSGNCGPAALGVLGGLGGPDTAVVWLDAHADFNTPETSPSGFLDGMAAAIAVGDCWRGPSATFRTLEAVPEDHVIQVGVRSVDPDEGARLDRSQVNRLGKDMSSLRMLIDRLSERVRGLYVHIDLDVFDMAELQANSYASSNGLRFDQVSEVIRTAGSRLSLSAASITALDPTLDAERAWSVALRLAHVVASCP
jgi:arginase